MKATASVILRISAPLSDGRYPVRLRIIWGRSFREYALPLNLVESLALSEADWHNIHSPRTRRDLREVKEKIAAYQARADEILRQWNPDEKPFSFEAFREQYFKQRDKTSLFQAFDLVVEELTGQGRIGTAISYKNARESIRRFAGSDKLPLTEVDVRFLDRYENWARQSGLSVSSIGIYLRSLKRIINWAIREGMLDQQRYPFEHYTIPSAVTRKRALHKDDIRKLYEYPAPPGSAQWRARQYFILSYLLQGINFTDLAYLKNRNIIAGRINYIRRKTHRVAKETKVLSIAISPQIEQIMLSLRAGDPDPEAYLFPILHDAEGPAAEKAAIKQFIKNTNKWLRHIARQVGVDPLLTTYYARHSYATQLKRNKVPVSLIQETLGHHNITTTERYLDSFENEEIDRANRDLL